MYTVVINEREHRLHSIGEVHALIEGMDTPISLHIHR